jgi:hypothetical protein
MRRQGLSTVNTVDFGGRGQMVASAAGRPSDWLRDPAWQQCEGFRQCGDEGLAGKVDLDRRHIITYEHV